MAVLLFYPFFTLVLSVNWIFLLLDEILFPFYRKQQVQQAVFIIGVPRSATTFLFNVLSQDTENFHCFKLWELLFAPSIIQKYVFLLIIKTDQLIGKPLYKLSIAFDNKVFSSFRNIHDIGLTKPEEDEVLFLYNFSSLYFYYFFPGLEDLDHILYHDQVLPPKVKRRNIQFYYRCIQRHNFVFDRNNQKYFLSKNPTFIPKMESIANKFKQAKFIYPIRSPYQTIPSTISLNARIFSNFSRLSTPYPFPDKTRHMLIEWYKQAEQVIKNKISDRTIQVNYTDLTGQTIKEFQKIYRFIFQEAEGKKLLPEDLIKTQKQYKSKHHYPKDLGIDKNEINAELSGILNPELLKEI
jgi:hypothetical protein